MTRSVLLLLLALGSHCAVADEITPCLDCHQPGNRQGEVPMVEGQHVEYLVNQLQRFRERHRQSFPMDALARGLDDADVLRIATALTDRPWRNWPSGDGDGRGDAQRLLRGAALAERYDCAACHGVEFRGGEIIPRLAGQHPGYVARQLAGFNSSGRHHPPTAIGAPITVLSPAEREDLAFWLSQVD